jgi:dTDP-4-dehydrorhamnose reductase
MVRKRILILGANGLLGTILTKSFASNSLFKIFTHSHSSQADFNQDLFNFDSVCDLLLSVNADFCINLFALTDVNLCEVDKAKANKLNVDPIRNIVRCVLQNRLDLKLIQISTDHVYNEALSKEENIKIVNHYALSKYIGDEISQLIGAAVLRTNFFGVSQSSKQSFSDWVIKSMTDKKEIKGYSDVFFSPLHITTLIAQIERVILNFNAGIFNLGSRIGLSKYEFMIELGKHKKINTECVSATEYKNTNFSIARPLNMTMDVSKFENAFKTNLPTLIEEIQKC